MFAATLLCTLSQKPGITYISGLEKGLVALQSFVALFFWKNHHTPVCKAVFERNQVFSAA